MFQETLLANDKFDIRFLCMSLMQPFGKTPLGTGFMKRPLSCCIVSLKGLPEFFNEHVIG
jgi:hypothetical protein